MEIKICTKNLPKLDAALAAVNGKAKDHTYSGYDLLAVSAAAEAYALKHPEEPAVGSAGAVGKRKRLCCFKQLQIQPHQHHCPHQARQERLVSHRREGIDTVFQGRHIALDFNGGASEPCR
jgi:hypothetical protein